MSYRKGRRFEWRVKELLESNGFFVVRAASSKPIDLVAVRAGEVFLVECKYGSSKPTEREKQKLVEIAEKAGAIPILAIKEKGSRSLKLINMKEHTAARF